MSGTFDLGSPLSRRLMIALALPAAACGEDATGPVDAELAGQWDYVITDAAGDCCSFAVRMSSITLTFTGNGDSLEGTVTAAGADNLELVGNDGTTLRTVTGTTSLENITVSGGDVAFEFKDLSSAALSSVTPFVSTGRITGNGDSMSGTVTFAMRFATANGPVERPLTGDWTATRK